MNYTRVLASIWLVISVLAMTNCTPGNPTGTNLPPSATPLSPALAPPASPILSTSQTNTLFFDPGNLPTNTPLAAPMTIRARLAKVNFDLLNGVIAPPGSAAQVKIFQLNLFADASFACMPERVDLHPKGFSILGKIQGVEKGQVTLAVENQALAGTVRVPGKLFQIRSIGDNLHMISEMDPRAFPPD
jgi:hypothetical protein